ncbi:MAG: hypothetical protein RLZZ05_519 [Bacteroidota bacterium]
MKSLMNIKSITIALASMIMLAACEKEYKSILTEETNLGNTAFVKFHNAIINSNRTYIYSDMVPLNGATIAYGGLFPSLSPSYTALAAGTRAIAIRDTLAPSTQYPISFNAPMTAGTFYTIFAYDSLNAPKYKVIQDNIQVFNDTAARVRFANFPFSTTAIPNVDIFSQKQQANVFTNISTAAVTDFISFSANISDTLYVRPTGTTNNLTQLNGLVATAKRNYTVIFRGSYRSTTGTAARTLTSFLSY